MKIVRSFPPQAKVLQRTSSFVEDQFPRCYVMNYDHAPLEEFKDDIVLLEWDIAVARDDLETFCWTASHTPGRVMVAPYRLYPRSLPELPPEGVYAHRQVTNSVTWLTRYATTADSVCDLFGFGMVYLPHELIRAYLEAAEKGKTLDHRMTDANFSLWHYQQKLGPVPINWAVKPVHLNYDPLEEYPWN